MHRAAAVRVIAAVGALSVLLAALSACAAFAGQFTVASCQADQLNFSTTAFGDFATRGMKIVRACNPEGPGLRGLITANAIRSGSVPRGAASIATINAPAGTTFTTLRWAGSARRRDCRFGLQLYADVPNHAPIPIKNVRANQNCSPHGHSHAAGYRARTYNVAGATRIVQRVICQGEPGHATCSARGANYIRTYQALVGVADGQPPAAAITQDTPLSSGAWVSGSQPLHYDAQDNVGVRAAHAVVGGADGGFDQRSCSMASPNGAFANPVPCPNGPGQITVDTRNLPEGTQQLVVQAQDPAGNVGGSVPVAARVDNTPPGRVDVAGDGGEGWRNQNSFTLSWSNPAEADRAPIVAALAKVCPAAGGGNCSQGEQDGEGIASLPIQVPSPGEWTVSLFRRDAAGNQDGNAASVPVTLRYDPEPPQLGFEQPQASDPTLVSVQVTDKTSGLADGAIEISPAGSDTWRTLDTKKDGSRLVARIDDSGLPAGNYVLRATAFDQARNQASTTQRLDGQPMAVTLPLRIASVMQAGVPRTRTVRRTVKRHGRRTTVWRRVTELRPASGVALGRRVRISGRLVNRDGQGIAGADVQVLSRSDISPEQLVAVLHTDAAGDYTYTATGSTSRVLRFAYPGSPLIVPAQSEVRLQVPAVSSLHVSRRRVLNGQAVRFSGRLRTLPIPAGGKLIELEVFLSGRWQTFRTARTDGAGRWALPYRFARTRGVQRYRFRVELPHEAGYPFTDGASSPVEVRVRGS
jgi:hypothetical protein